MLNALWNDDKTGGRQERRGSLFRTTERAGNLTCKDSAEFAKMVRCFLGQWMVDRHLFGRHDTSYKYRPLTGLQSEIIRPKAHAGSE